MIVFELIGQMRAVANFMLAELRGFEPLTSAVQAPARLTGSSLPFLCGSSATSATARAKPYI